MTKSRRARAFLALPKRGCFQHIRPFRQEIQDNDVPSSDRSLLSIAAEMVDWPMSAFGGEADMT